MSKKFTWSSQESRQRANKCEGIPQYLETRTGSVSRWLWSPAISKMSLILCLYNVQVYVQPPWPRVNARTWRHRTSGASCVKYSAPPFTAQARRPSNTGQIHRKRARLNFPTSYQLRHVPATFQDAILKSPTQFHSVAPQSVQALFFWKDRIHLYPTQHIKSPNLCLSTPTTFLIGPFSTRHASEAGEQARLPHTK